MIDQPAPIGFSYCNDDDSATNSSHSCGGIAWTDELASLNAYTALTAFYTTKFPCLVHKELYLTGESYAGIYIPTLARRIVEGNKEQQKLLNTKNHDQTNNIVLNLKGFAVGDGWYVFRILIMIIRTTISIFFFFVSPIYMHTICLSLPRTSFFFSLFVFFSCLVNMHAHNKSRDAYQYVRGSRYWGFGRLLAVSVVCSVYFYSSWF